MALPIDCCCFARVAPPDSASVRSSSPGRSVPSAGASRFLVSGTTAALLLRQLGRFETVVMRFDQIEDAVLRGDADCGVLIHEGRFTYEAKGLTLLADLGQVWEERMHCPLPLAAIAIRRDLAPHLAPAMDAPSRRASNTRLRIRMQAATTWPRTRRRWIPT